MKSGQNFPHQHLACCGSQNTVDMSRSNCYVTPRHKIDFFLTLNSSLLLPLTRPRLLSMHKNHMMLEKLADLRRGLGDSI